MKREEVFGFLIAMTLVFSIFLIVGYGTIKLVVKVQKSATQQTVKQTIREMVKEDCLK